MKKKVEDEVKRVFRPEFLNRVGTTLVFHPLSVAHIRSIVDLSCARTKTACGSRA